MTDGKFHFNWGWRGSSDGYFALNVLNPNVSKGYIYNWRQFCITDIVPATKVENESGYSLQTPFIGFDGNLTWGKYPDDSTVGNCLYANDGSSRKVQIANYGHENLKHDLHIALIPWEVEEHYKRFKARRYIIKTTENCDWVAGDGGVYYVNGIPSRLEGVPYWTYDVVLMYTRKNAASAASLDFASAEPEYVIPSDKSRGQVYMDVYEDGSWKIENDRGLVTGVSDITVEAEDMGAVRRVVGLNGVTVAVNPTAEELSALPAGLYLYVHDNGTRKVVK